MRRGGHGDIDTNGPSERPRTPNRTEDAPRRAGVLRQEDEIQSQVGERLRVIVHEVNELLASQFVVAIFVDTLKNLGHYLLGCVHIWSNALVEAGVVLED